MQYIIPNLKIINQLTKKPEDLHSLLLDEYAIDGSVKQLYPREDLDIVIEDRAGKQLLVRVFHDHRDLRKIESRAKVAAMLNEENPHIYPRILSTKYGSRVNVCTPDGVEHLFVVMEHKVGDRLSDIPRPRRELLETLGRQAGQVSNLLNRVEPAPFSQDSNWRPQYAMTRIVENLAIHTQETRGLLLRTLELIDLKISTMAERLPKAVIYNDWHHQDIVVHRHVLNGITGFGNMTNSYRIWDPASLIAHQLIKGEPPHRTISDVLKGYTAVTKPTSLEIDLLLDLILLNLGLVITVVNFQLNGSENNSIITNNNMKDGALKALQFLVQRRGALETCKRVTDNFLPDRGGRDG